MDVVAGHFRYLEMVDTRSSADESGNFGCIVNQLYCNGTHSLLTAGRAEFRYLSFSLGLRMQL
jgi:hypothetical protein